MNSMQVDSLTYFDNLVPNGLLENSLMSKQQNPETEIALVASTFSWEIFLFSFFVVSFHSLSMALNT